MLFILICTNTVAQNKTVVEQPKYSQTEYDLKLQLENQKDEIQLINEKANIQIESFNQRLQKQDQYITNETSYMNFWIAFSGIFIAFLGLIATGFSIFSTWKVNISEININNQLDRAKAQAEKSKNDIEKQVQICHNLIEDIEKAKKQVAEYVDSIKHYESEAEKIFSMIINKKNILDNKEYSEESLEIDKYVNNLTKTKTESQYDDYDWAIKGLKAYMDSKYDESVIYYRKVSNNFINYEMILNLWGIALSDMAKIKNDPKLFLDSFEKFQKALEIKPQNNNIISNWKTALDEFSKIKNSRKLFSDSVKKYNEIAGDYKVEDITFNNKEIDLFKTNKKQYNSKPYIDNIVKGPKVSKIVSEVNDLQSFSNNSPLLLNQKEKGAKGRIKNHNITLDR